MQLERVRGFHGCDWFPSWARSPVDYWSAGMPVDTMARELGFVAAMGFDHVRVWLSAWGHEIDPSAHMANLRALLDAAGRQGLGVVMELFDSCGIEPSTGDATTVRDRGPPGARRW